MVEEAMIARARAKSWIVRLQETEANTPSPTAQRALKGHTIIYPQDPDKLTAVLPPPIGETLTFICVIFVGSSKLTNEWLRDKAKPLVLYCNGQYCQASRQLSEQLVNAGFTNVRRYQLGIPMWRALNGPVEIELEGILRLYKIDQTALFFDARSVVDFAKASLPGTHNVQADQLATEGLRKAPMPSNDFNTRIVLFGHDSVQARALADALGKTPFQNVSYFPGTFDALAAAVKTQ